MDGDVKLPPAEYEKLLLPVLGDVFSYEPDKDDIFVCAIADPAVRKKLVEIVTEKFGKKVFSNLIHRSVTIQSNVKIGTGNIFVPGSAINDSAVIGNHIILNGAAISHDCIVGDYSSFMGNVIICGNVKIGEMNYWATGSVALPKSRTDNNVFVGCGSFVFKHIKEGLRVFGNPAMPY